MTIIMWFLSKNMMIVMDWTCSTEGRKPKKALNRKPSGEHVGKADDEMRVDHLEEDPEEYGEESDRG